MTLQDIERKCDQFEEEARVRVTPQAQKLIFVILRGMEEDPHPNWWIKDEREQLAEEAKALLQKLPQMLRRLLEADPELRRRERITTFDLAHRMTWLVEIFCGLDKIR